ncbi:hypothetical protein [Paenibacillus thiaminolyticus]|uniref:Uncharacterized protein n=1 Tax=Paenibacillus thiaminolyticus TaxID=49283 RepID=A0A3A3GAX1_PANTH|nr:hypothetical protein [Paenibacillus thiaminolyticus]RJG18866.1 hypothetical protein DQX05_26805 [Paenibacillus thiaminolyticus]
MEIATVEGCWEIRDAADRAMQIVEGHVPELREATAQGWDIEVEITLSGYTSLRPLHTALLVDQPGILRQQAEHPAHSRNYSAIVIVWSPKSRCIGYYDVEHQEYADLCPFAEFMAHPEVYLAKKIIEGEL